MLDSDFNFDIIDFSSIIINETKEIKEIKKIKEIEENTDKTISNNKNLKNIPKNIKYDNTTNETYRIKRLFKIDPFTDQEIPSNLIFEFVNIWNPYNGIRDKPDPIGPLCFNAISLYDYYFTNRYKGLWNPPTSELQGFYGDFVGTSKKISIKSRGVNPEKYLFRLPIMDCYLPPNHNYSVITMGPELTDSEIYQIDLIVVKSHPKKTVENFTTLQMMKFYYDNALNPLPDQDLDEIKELKKKYPNLNKKEINEKYNRYWVDKLVKLKY